MSRHINKRKHKAFKTDIKRCKQHKVPQLVKKITNRSGRLLSNTINLTGTRIMTRNRVDRGQKKNNNIQERQMADFQQELSAALRIKLIEMKLKVIVEC